MTSNRSPSTSFVGRQREMETLTAALGDSLTGRGRMVMLAGEPGIGKTRTVQELLPYAESLGAEIWWGSCHEQQGAPPYWPWIQPIRSYMQRTDSEFLGIQMGSGAAYISEVILEVRDRFHGLDPVPSLEPEQARFHLFDSIARFLKNVAQLRGLILVLDDLHWADQPSLLLLEFLAGQLRDSKILIIGTYRDDEVTRAHPLSNTLARLARTDGYQREKLLGLEREHVGQLITGISGVEPSKKLIEAIYDHTEGNPFFMAEAIRLVGTNSQRGEDSIDLEIPKSVLEVIGQRLNRLSKECEDILTTAAIIGRQFDFRLLEILSEDLNESRLLETVDEGLDAHLIQELPGRADLYQFSHDLIKQTLRERISTSRRVRLHATIGESMEMLYRDRPDEHAAELAYHFAEASPVLGPEKLVRYTILAGENELASNAHDEALLHFQQGLGAMQIATTGTESVNDSESAALLYGFGRAQLITQGRSKLSEATSCLCRAFNYYEEAGELENAVKIAQYPFPQAIGLRTGAAQLIKRALAFVQNGSHDEGVLLSQYSRSVFSEENDYEAACDAYNQASVIAHRENDIGLELRTLSNAAVADAFHGNYRESIKKSERGIELACRVNNPSAELDLQYWSGGIKNLVGDSQGAKLNLERARTLAEGFRHQFWLATIAWTSAQTAIFEGDWEAAGRFSGQGLELFPNDCRSLGTRVQLEFEQGKFDQGAQFLERLIQAMRLAPAGPNFESMIPALGLPLAARISGIYDYHEVAKAAADAVISAPNASKMVLWGARAGLGLMAVQRGDSIAAADQYAALSSGRGTGTVVISLCLDRLLGLLSQAMGDLELAVDHYKDSLSFCREADYRPELA